MAHSWIPNSNDELLEHPLLGTGHPAAPPGHGKQKQAIKAGHLDLEALAPGLKEDGYNPYFGFAYAPVVDPRATNLFTLCQWISRTVQLISLLSASMILVNMDFADFPLPRSWAFSLGTGLAYSSFSLVWILALLIMSFGKKSSINTNVIITSLVYDLCCSILLFGAAIAVVPDSSGGQRAFDAEKHYIASSLRGHRHNEQSHLIDDPEFWDVQDSFKRVHRSASAVCFFLTSISSVLSLAYVSMSQLQFKLPPASQPQ